MSSIDDARRLLTDIDSTIAYYKGESRLENKKIRTIERALEEVASAITNIISLPEDQRSSVEKKIQEAKLTINSSSRTLWNAVHFDYNPRIKNTIKDVNELISSYNFPSKSISITGDEIGFKTLTPDEYEFAKISWSTTSSIIDDSLKNLYTNFQYSFLQQNNQDKDLHKIIWDRYFPQVKKYTHELIVQNEYQISEIFFDFSEQIVVQVVKALPPSLSQDEINGFYYALLNTHSEYIRELFGAPARTAHDLEELRASMEGNTPQEGEKETPFVDNTRATETESEKVPPYEEARVEEEIFQEDTIENSQEQEESLESPSSKEEEEREVMLADEKEDDASLMEVKEEEEVPSIFSPEEVISDAVSSSIEMQTTSTPTEEPVRNLAPQEEVDAFVIQAKAFVKAGFDKILKVYEKVHPEVLMNIPKELNRYGTRLLNIKHELQPLLIDIEEATFDTVLLASFSSKFTKSNSLYEKFDVHELTKQITTMFLEDESTQGSGFHLLEQIADGTFKLFHILEKTLPLLQETKEIGKSIGIISKELQETQNAIKSYEYLKEDNFYKIFHGVEPKSLLSNSGLDYDSKTLTLDTTVTESKIEIIVQEINELTAQILRPLLEEDFPEIQKSFQPEKHDHILELRALLDNLTLAVQIYMELKQPSGISKKIEEEDQELIQTTLQDISASKNVSIGKTVAELKAEKEKSHSTKMSIKELNSHLYNIGSSLEFWSKTDLYGRKVEIQGFTFQHVHKIIFTLLYNCTSKYPNGLQSTQLCKFFNAIIKMSDPEKKFVTPPEIHIFLKEISYLVNENSSDTELKNIRHPLILKEELDEDNTLISTYQLTEHAASYISPLRLAKDEYIEPLHIAMDKFLQKETKGKK